MHSLLRFILLILFISGSIVSLAQTAKGKVSGVVISDSSKTSIAGATVSLMNTRDSSVEKLVITNRMGQFLLADLGFTEYKIIITEINHDPVIINVLLGASKPLVHLDSLVMPVKSNRMDEIIITSQKLPVVFKEDTVEFNASSFKVKQNAVVEDLLKKLPGLEVDKNGNVMANGEKVTQIYVDGKPFFGNDPKMATQNLPVEIIDKVQVIDQKSEQYKATKVEDGVVERVINITIKKDKKKGYFGRAYAGYGSQNMFEGRLNANQFNDERKISLVAGANNTGRTDHNSGENQEFTNYNNNNGLTRDISARLNYTDKWGKKLNMNIFLGFGDNENETQHRRSRQNIIGDSTNLYYEESRTVRSRNGFNGGFNLEYKPDTLTKVNMQQHLNFQENRYRSEALFHSSSLSKRRLNEGNRNNFSINRNPTTNGNLSIQRSFKKKGRGLFFNLNNNLSNSLGDGFNLSNNYFYPYNGADYERILNQFLNNDNRYSFVNASGSYNHRIGKKSHVTLSVNYNYNKNNNIRETFDFNNATNIYDLLNDTLSNRFDNITTNSSVGANYSYGIKKGSIALGTTWQNNKTKSISLDNDSIYQQKFKGLVPYASLNMFDKGKRLSLTYNYGTRQPQAYQLQAIVDNSNPLFIRMGNPHLKFSSTHRFSLNTGYNHPRSGFHFNMNSNYQAIVNNISTSTTVEHATGIQTSQPVNVSGVKNGSLRLTTGKPIKVFGKKNSWNFNVNYNFNRNVSLLNAEENIGLSQSVRSGASINIELKDIAHLGLSYTAGMQSVKYSIREEQNNRTFSHELGVDLVVTPNQSSEIVIDWNFVKNTGNMQGFDREFRMVNADITHYLNKGKTWWLKLKVYDLLKQNINIYRFSGENFIEDMETNILSRYFMLSVNFKLNRFGGK